MGFTFEYLWRMRKQLAQFFSPLSVFSSAARCQIPESHGFLWIASLERETEEKQTAQYHCTCKTICGVLLIKGIQTEKSTQLIKTQILNPK